MSYQGRGKNNRDGNRAGRAQQPMQAIKKPTDGLQLLLYKSGGISGNLVQWRKSITIKAFEKFGDLARVLETREYYSPPEIEIPDVDALEGLALRVAESKYIQQVTKREDFISNMRMQRSSLYAFIWQNISLESEQIVQQRVEWTELSTLKCPRMLWINILATHSISTSGNTAVDEEDLDNRYKAVRQTNEETIVMYADRFRSALNMFTEMRLNPPNDEKQAIRFIMNLDNRRYEDLQNKMRENTILGDKDAYPKS